MRRSGCLGGAKGGNRLRFQLDATGMEVVPDGQMGRCGMWKRFAGVMEQ